jgi:hypothetical protein
MSSAGGGGVPTTFEVETSDVIKLILQFCKENHLLHTLKTLQEESQVRTSYIALAWLHIDGPAGRDSFMTYNVT